MQLISKFNKGIFLLRLFDINRKNAWVVSLKDKTGVAIINVFQKNSDNSNHKPNKIWVNNGSRFYDRSMKLWLQDNITI